MDKFEYTCEYCGRKYIPKRRKVQRFCSNSCRTRNWQQQQQQQHQKLQLQSEEIQKPEVEILPNQLITEKKDTVNMAGVGNAALGVAAANVITNILTKPRNKPATKGDIEELKSNFFGKRYFLIKNIPIQPNGKKAYFDIQKSELVYF